MRTFKVWHLFEFPLSFVSSCSEHLSGTRFASEESLAQIVEEFDQRTKLTFRDETPWCFIKFGGVADRDNTVGIRNGQLKLPGFVSVFLACVHMVQSFL